MDGYSLVVVDYLTVCLLINIFVNLSSEEPQNYVDQEQKVNQIDDDDYSDSVVLEA